MTIRKFTITIGKTFIYIVIAIILFLMSFMIAANAQQSITLSSSGTALTCCSANGSLCYTCSGPSISVNKEKPANNHLYIWKWLAMLSCFGGGIIFSIKVFEEIK